MNEMSIDNSSSNGMYSEQMDISPSSITPLSASIVSHQASQQEIDAFRMKAITLLKGRGGISFSYLKEQIHQIPIIVIQEEAAKEELSSGPIVTLLQTLSIPGETIKLKGVFKRQSSGICSTPIPESFQLIM